MAKRMQTLEGNYKSASILTDNIELSALCQIKMICDLPAVESYKQISIMPDVHRGKIGPIGLVMQGTKDSPIFPGLIGPDIGCGVMAIKFKGELDFNKLDKVIMNNVPSGSAIRNKPSKYFEEMDDLSMGTLGGGNHFIEVDKSANGDKWLIIHTGSRSKGFQVYKKYMDLGHKELKNKDVPYELTYLTGSLKEEYLEEAEFCNFFAFMNRTVIYREIFNGMKWKEIHHIDTVHNFIDINKNNGSFILRKGAQSLLNKEIIIPINMAQGCIIGETTEDLSIQCKWLYSAPHGSGRKYSREACKQFTLPEFKKSMGKVYSSCINRDTIDECPKAYNDYEYISNATKETTPTIRLIKTKIVNLLFMS